MQKIFFRDIKIYPMNIFMIIEIKNPKDPIIKIPTAETFATFKKSSREGFFRTIHTLLHFSIKDFNEVKIFID